MSTVNDKMYKNYEQKDKACRCLISYKRNYINLSRIILKSCKFSYKLYSSPILQNMIAATQTTFFYKQTFGI